MSERRFVLIHNHMDWEVDITEELMQLPGTYTDFMGSIYRVPSYVFRPNEKAKVLVLIIQALLKSAPEDIAEAHLRDLKQLRAQLEQGQCYGDRLERAEQKLMMSFGHDTLPRLVAVPDSLLPAAEAMLAASASSAGGGSTGSNGWIFFIVLLALAGAGFLLWPY